MFYNTLWCEQLWLDNGQSWRNSCFSVISGRLFYI